MKTCRKCGAEKPLKLWRKKRPDAYRAHSALNNAVRDHRLEKEPCYFCGTPEVHAHHHDYSKPLDVTWLCVKCHQRLHALEARA
jgi:hypothetical protein